MTGTKFCSVILTAAMVLTLCTVPAVAADRQAKSRPAAVEPQSKLPSQGQVDGAVVGITVGAVVGTVVVIYLLTRKKSITGCVNSAANGMTITNENDKLVYAIAGGSSGITAGHRVKLQGKKIKGQIPADGSVWETEKMTKDFGPCH